MDRIEINKGTLRDALAENRTLLANERTFLAYLRTAFSLAAVGLTFIKFFQVTSYIWIGSMSITLGVMIAIYGSVRYKRNVKKIISYKIT
ncbi:MULTISPECIES: YidH family protein [unclassified Fusibacter]|uniref:YidH family protein n=1 Tax=unclassified Fusibacter TaxID=2624464 RepID=UPI00101393A5|nr:MULTISPECIES: DUF202 domain-containing protein [unclassified Fusibacter]MCK8061618.1 DUF202 domain-containing protein [Fusibacter sp. A2]NPE23801.1 DUF202 domain-containing protein [Fusibacter sp. A1]RXV58639.1 DUF202 domain-containing protein [Fusibacter sp. A1]